MEKSIKYTRIAFLIILFLVLLSSAYAWFSDQTNPTITESELKVTSAEGLLIKTTVDGELRNYVNLDELLGEPLEFRLKQVSSQNAINYFKIDFGQGLAFQEPQFVPVVYLPNGTLNMMEYGYIDYDFYLQTELYGKSVFLHRDTKFDGPGAAAMRLAITITEDNNVRLIFGDEPENGITSAFTTKAVHTAGIFTYGTNNPEFVGNQVVNHFSEKGGGKWISDNDPVNPNKILVDIPAKTAVKVNIKIWLEGGDVDCINSLGDTYLDALIKFGSADILLPAPVLSTTIQRRINGLTTAMEYYIGTNVSNAVWTMVNDPMRTFPTGSTVHVRIAEIEGVSLPSYIRTLQF